ncbi:MAG: gephyrin-like molybdotransferase Glp [Xanthobacteraceae bacterium]
MGLMPVAEALARVLERAAPLPSQEVPLAQAHGCVLAADIAALRTQPPADVSAMDGYAVRAEDVAAAPATLRLVGEVAAGHPFAGAVHNGEAARIFTGGVLPPGTDTVVIQELAERDGDRVVITKATPKTKNVRAAGLDFSRGDVLLRQGRRLTSRDLALAAAMNHATVPVHRMPHVAVLATGDELVAPGSEPRPGEIVYSNGFALTALARQEGAQVTDLGVAPDRLAETMAAIRRAREVQADVLVTVGGASVGEYDFVQQALTAEGLALSFWKVALRPGKPMLHGHLAGTHVLGLPGNPVSSFVSAVLFLIPLIRRLAGRSDITPPVEWAVLGRDLPANDERADYLRARLSQADGATIAMPWPLQDSSMLAALAAADCLLIREPHAPPAKSGSPCAILKLGL